MRIRIVSKRDEIADIKNEKALHLAYRPSNKDIFGLVDGNSELKAIQIPPSYLKTLSGSIKIYLEMQGIKIIEGDVWGHRKDIDPYFNISDETIKKFEEGNLQDYEFKGNREIIKALL